MAVLGFWNFWKKNCTIQFNLVYVLLNVEPSCCAIVCQRDNQISGSPDASVLYVFLIYIWWKLSSADELFLILPWQSIYYFFVYAYV